jgi:Mg2+-importing ATPase
MSDPALGHVVEQTSLFARVSPAQKNRIILALKHRSHVVGVIASPQLLSREFLWTAII